MRPQGLLILLVSLWAAGCIPSAPVTPIDTPSTPAAVADLCPDDTAKTQPGACGCGVPDTDTNGNGIADCLEPPPASQPVTPPAAATTGAIAGRLTVQADATTTVIEHEPNDRLTQTQFVANVSAGQRITIFGQASVPLGDRFDAYEFLAPAAVQIEATLTFADGAYTTPADLDLALHDFKNFTCAPGGVGNKDFAECFDGPGNPRTASMQVSGPFVLVVAPFAGTAEYQLDLVISAPGTKSSAALTRKAADLPVVTSPLPAPPPPPPFTDLADAAVPGELLVRFDEQLTPTEQEALLGRCGMQLIERSPSGVCRVACPLDPPAGDRRAKALGIETLSRRALLRGQPGIRAVETNHRRYIARTPNDRFEKFQWHYAAINLPDAWDLTTGSDDVVVAVLDTGILHHHPDLQGRIAGGYDFISDPASARDHDGRDPDPEDPGDLFGGPGQSSFHGTHVAGTIAAATDNTTGVAGVTWKTKVMPLRVLGAGGGTTFDLVEALRYAAGLPNASGTVPPKPARIVNLSLSGPAGEPPSPEEAAAVNDVLAGGAMVVAAAGNEDTSQPAYPAANPGVIAVGAVDIQLQRAPYSNFGRHLSLVAPGGFNGADLNGDGYPDGVLSTSASDAGGSISYEYVFENGTSMAAPHVAGVAALVMAANPALTAAQVRDVLQSTARDLGATGRDDQFGYGLVDAAAAVREALRRAGSAPASSPVLALSTTSIDFGEQRTEFQVHISNTGGGFLNLTGAATSELDGHGWLSAQLQGPAANASADSALITVNRDGQPEGTYRGTTTITAEGLAAQAISVSMTVGGSPMSETIYVLATLPPPASSTIAQAQTDAAHEFVYELPKLPPGQYAIFAGTDRNRDGTICDVGDLCGAWPTTIEPKSIPITAGQGVTGVDFTVSQRVLKQVAGANTPGIPRLR